MRTPFRLLLPTLFLAAPAFSADTYKIDAVHSEVSFKIRHLVAKSSGRFTKFSGSVQLDEKNISKSSVQVNIESASVNTDNEGRDKHLRSADFFDIEKFPTITFKSTDVKEVSKGKLLVTGDFTLHGVTKRISFPITNIGAQVSPMDKKAHAGFIDGTLTINRNDFGIKTFPGVLGDDVEISLNVEAIKEEAAPDPKK